MNSKLKLKSKLDPNSKSKPKSKSASWGITVFGLCFLIPALIILVMGPLNTFRLHFLTSFWEQIPAKLISIDVKPHHGNDSTTYSLEGTYSFNYLGITYHSSQISYFNRYDNLGDWHSKSQNNILQAAAKGRLIAWVNADNPNESYLVRDIRPSHMFLIFIFVLVFGGTGAALILYGRYSGKKPSNENGILYSVQQYTHWILGFMAFIFITISLPAVIAIPSEMASGNAAILVALVFPLAGLGMAYAARHSLKNWRYYGRTPLLLNPYPAKNSGQIGGEITVAHRGLKASWSVTLQCVRKVKGTGKNSSSHETVLWQRKTQPEIREVGDKTLVRFVFSPDEELPASYQKGRTSLFWRLSLQGPQTPVKLERNFVIPVEEGVGHSTVELTAEHVSKVSKKQLIEAKKSISRQLEIREHNDEFFVVSKAGRHLSMSLWLTVMGAIFAGVGLFLFHQAATEGLMLYFMGSIFSLFGVPCFFGGIFMLGRSLETSISGGVVHTKRSWFGRPLWRRKAHFHNGDQLILNKSGSMTSGAATTEFFNIDLNYVPSLDSGGKQVTIRIAEGIDNREAGEFLIARLNALLVSDELL
ncbi:MAG: DUF3592 domain-containing protein [Oleibacter sp.]|nr:DUF3592 domain-containing protein [Thalassolituus sp.]